LKNSKNKKPIDSSKELKELDKMNEQLQDFIDKNESLKNGITKIFDEIVKGNKNKN